MNKFVKNFLRKAPYLTVALSLPAISYSQGLSEASAEPATLYEKYTSIMQSDVVLHTQRAGKSHRLVRGLRLGEPEGTRLYIALPEDDGLTVGYTRSRVDNEMSCVSMRAFSLMPAVRSNGREKLAPASISMWIENQEDEMHLFQGETHGRIEVVNPEILSVVSISWTDESGVAVLILNTPGHC